MPNNNTQMMTTIKIIKKKGTRFKHFFVFIFPFYTFQPKVAFAAALWFRTLHYYNNNDNNNKERIVQRVKKPNPNSLYSNKLVCQTCSLSNNNNACIRVRICMNMCVFYRNILLTYKAFIYTQIHLN